MFITGLGTVAPSRRFTQKECWEFAKADSRIARLTPSSRAILRKVLLGDNGIEARHLVLESLDEVFELDPDSLHRRFAQHAPALATAAAERALAGSGTAPDEIDALIVSTCTGYLCPGLTSYVSERLRLKPATLLLDLVGQGCGAAVPNLRTAEALLSANRACRVLSVCVEVCSAAFYLDDDPGVLVSACLFGDGAAAAVLSQAPNVWARRVEWRSAATCLNPDARDYLRFEHRNGMLRNVLTRQVSDLAAKHAELVLTEALQDARLHREEIAAWIMHSGGRAVLEAVGERLRLTPADLRWSAGILREYGNLSSPCVLFVLDAALAGGAPGGWWWLSSFGAGFSCHGAILRVERP